MLMQGSYQGPVEKTAKAFGMQLNVSPKSANEVCYVIRGKMTEKALELFERVEKKESPILYRRYTDGIGHRSGGQIGRYPIKAVKLVKKLVKSAVSNAESKGLDSKKLKIIHSTAYKTISLDRITSKGRSHPSKIDLTNIEIVVKEV